MEEFENVFMDEADAPLQFYVATTFSNREQAKKVIAALENHQNGNFCICTHDWTNETFDDYENKKFEICMADYEGAAACDVFILLMPDGRGACTELGVALHAGAICLIWGENEKAFKGNYPYENIFNNHENVKKIIMTFEDFISTLNASGLEAFEI